MNAGIYIRVSTQEQALEGFSLAAQTARLRAYCESQSWSVVDIYADEGVSAKDTVRPQLQRLLQDVASRRIDVVLVYKLDRLTRSVSDLYELLRLFDKYSVGFKSATEIFDTTTAIGRLFITMVAAMAQWERETIGERVGIGQDQKALEGRRVTGVAPFGYRKEGETLIVNEAEAQVVRELFHRYISGEGLHRLRRWLLKRYPRDGSKWDSHTISYILENPVYAGKIRWNYRSSRANAELIITDGDHPPLISEQTWASAQAVRKRRRQYAPRSGTGRFILTGLIFCKRCGGTMHGHYGRKYTYYRCANAVLQHCDALLMRADKVTDLVVHALNELSEPTLQKLASSVHVKSSRTTANTAGARTNLEARKRRLWDAYEVGSLKLEELEGRLAKIHEEEAVLARIEAEQTTVDAATMANAEHRHVRTAIEQFDAGWRSLGNLQRKELLRTILERVDVDAMDGTIHVTLKQM